MASRQRRRDERTPTPRRESRQPEAAERKHVDQAPDAAASVRRATVLRRPGDSLERPPLLPGDVQTLQQALGNRVVNRLLARPPEAVSDQSPSPIQAKLTVGPANDQYEQEADRVARQVVGHVNTVESTPSPSDQDTLREQPPAEEEEIRRVAPPAARRQRIDDGAGDVSADVEASIRAERGSGQALAENIRRPMEEAFGADFSGVKVHTDAHSDALNRSIQARAFTTGQDIFFADGEYEPDSHQGRQLLAHELTHVVQQDGNRTVVERIQRLTVTAKNKKQVDALRKRYVTATGGEGGWKEVLGGARDLAALEQAVTARETPQEEGSGEDEKAKVDRHGGKHLRGRNRPTSKREMKEKSKTQPATFYPSVNYKTLLQQVVPLGEESGSSFVDVGEIIGVDRGEETSIVEIYGSGDVGYHIRPKSQNYIKNFRSKKIPSLGSTVSSPGKDVKEVPHKEEGKEEGREKEPESEKKKSDDGVPERIEGVGRIENVDGQGMNCLIRAIYRSIGVAIDGNQVGIIRQHLQNQGVAQEANMLNLAGAAGAVLIAYLIAQGVIAANRGIVVYSPDHMDHPHQIINGPNPISLWLSDNHFRGIVPGG